MELICEWGQPRSLAHAMQEVTATRALQNASPEWRVSAKWQCVVPERIATAAAPRYWAKELGGGETQRETFAGRQLDVAEWGELLAVCRDRGVNSVVSPFDVNAVEMLSVAGVGALKVASGEITHRELLAEVGKYARNGMPVILSTGGATISEVKRAVLELGALPTLLACDLVYPCSLTNVSLATQLPELRKTGLGSRYGYSDHTAPPDSNATATAAGTLGATVLEKHVRLEEPHMPVPDDQFALSIADVPAYLAAATLGTVVRAAPVGDPQRAARVGARRSAYAAYDLPAGWVLAGGEITWLRPAEPGSLGPCAPWLGGTLRCAVAEGEPILPNYLDPWAAS